MPREYTRLYDRKRSYTLDDETDALLRLVAAELAAESNSGERVNKSRALRYLVRKEATERKLVLPDSASSPFS